MGLPVTSVPDAPRIAAGENQARNPGQDDRPHAHDAGLEGHVERTAEQPPGTERRGGLPDGDHLGMGGRVVARLPQIAPTADNLAPPDDNGPDRNLTQPRCGFGFHQGLLHEAPGLRIGKTHGDGLVIVARHERFELPAF